MSPRALVVPGDKSVTHRALMLAALAAGESRLDGALVSLDTGSTAQCLRALGAAIPPLDPGPLVIRGAGLRGLRPPAGPLDCGNSGTTARLLLGLLAGTGVRAELTGDVSLRGRPMRRVTAPLGLAGARFTELGAPDRLPIRVEGGVTGAVTFDAPQASGQVKSALLLAALTGGVPARLSEPWLSRDHTERMLRAMGAPCVSDRSEHGRSAVALGRVSSLRPLEMRIPGDFSSAAFLLAWGLLAGDAPVRIRSVGLNPTRTGFLDVVARMGGGIVAQAEHDTGGEPAADLVASRASLRGTTVTAEEIPRLIDEVPMIAVLAARAAGETRIEGAGELRVKESDRIAAMAGNLRAVGARAEETPDGLVIEGTDQPLSGRVRTEGDHRVAMAFGVLAALPGNEIRIDNPAAADVSFPGFWATLATLAPGARIP